MHDKESNMKIGNKELHWLRTNSGMLTVKNESFLSSQPSHDVSGSKMYVLFGMNVTMLWSLLQLSTSLNLNSLKKKVNNVTFIHVHCNYNFSG